MVIKTSGDIIKYIFGHHHNFRLQKIVYVIVMIFIFSIIYTFFDNEEFAGWIELSDTSLLFEMHRKQKFKIFSHYAKKYRNFLDQDEFMKIPIVKIGNSLIIADKPSEKSNAKEDLKIRKFLFDIYAMDNKMSIDEFTSIPIKLDTRKEYSAELLKAIDLSNKFSVTDYFDRLYYSTTIQTTLGFGDIFPADKMLRFYTMLQALSTIFIIVI